MAAAKSAFPGWAATPPEERAKSCARIGDGARAIDIANDSEHGLAGGVWSGDQDHAIAVARRIRTG